MVNLELYKIFVMVASQKNLTKASQLLNISQPAVTKHIRNLEKELQVTLFIRNKLGMQLTDDGRALYDGIKDHVNVLINAEKTYGAEKNIKLGVHATMLNKVFSKCIGIYYKENKNSKIKVANEDINEMMMKLENKELDIVLSKKVKETNFDNNKISYIPLGYLHDILVANNNFRLNDKLITQEDLKDLTIYTPRRTSITTIKFLERFKLDENKIKNITYNTMLQIIQADNEVGLVTKEYIEDEINSNKIIVLNTEFNLEAIEFGIYLNNNRFKELNKLVEIIKNEFNK